LRQGMYAETWQPTEKIIIYIYQQYPSQGLYGKIN